jgi:outer membrane biosynthesis protein TonB
LAEYSSSQNSPLQKLLATLVVASAFIVSAFVVMYLSFRSSEVSVPTIIGKSEADAEKLLNAQGLRLKVRNRATDEKIDTDLISEQIPSANSSAKSGQLVSVTVSTGIQAREKKEEEKIAKVSATPKPKPSASPTPKDNKDKDNKDKSKDSKNKEKPKDDKAAKTDPQTILSNKNITSKDNKDNKVADKAKLADDKLKVKPTVTPSPKASSKPAVKEN